MNHIKPIKTNEQNEKALERLLFLMDKNPEIGTIESDEIEVLSILIEKFEKEHFPIDKPDPIEAIKFRMDQQGLSHKDLIPFIGSKSKVSEVLSRKRPLSLNMIRQLSKGLNISADVLIKSSGPTTSSKSALNFDGFPLTLMFNRGYLSDYFAGTLADLNENAPEVLRRFFSLNCQDFEKDQALISIRRSLKNFSRHSKVDHYSLLAWKVRVLQKANREKLSKRFEANSLNETWMANLTHLSSFENPLERVKQYLNESGIYLIIEEHLPKTYLDGALFLANDTNPIVALTLRDKSVERFWFALMHELGHLTLHLEAGKSDFFDDFDAKEGHEIEKEADTFAKDALISPMDWKELFGLNDKEVKQAAESLGISPCIVAGRIRQESGNLKKFGRLFRDKMTI